MASKPAPLVAARTRSTEKTKQEKEAAARAAALASAAARAAAQAAEEAASLAAARAVAAALAGVEARFAALEEARRQQDGRLHRGRRRFGEFRRALHFCIRASAFFTEGEEHSSTPRIPAPQRHRAS